MCCYDRNSTDTLVSVTADQNNLASLPLAAPIRIPSIVMWVSNFDTS